MSKNNTNHGEPHDDEATMPASSDALDEIRAEAVRVRSEQAAAFDPSDDPTTVMADLGAEEQDSELGDEPTIIGGFDPAEDPTVITFDTHDDPTTSDAFDPSEDPTTVMASTASSVKNPGVSLIDGKEPPVASASYWDRNELGAATMTQASTGKGPVPKWFLATSFLAVLMACGLVLLVLWALSGST